MSHEIEVIISQEDNDKIFNNLTMTWECLFIKVKTRLAGHSHNQVIVQWRYKEICKEVILDCFLSHFRPIVLLPRFLYVWGYFIFLIE